MKYFPLLLFPFLFSYSYGQLNETDFSKYSYFIFGYIKEGVISDSIMAVHTFNATGFFIRENNNLYFITAKHVFTGCDSGSTKLDSMPNEMYIYKQSMVKPLQINSKIIHDTSACLPFKKNADIVAIPINIKDTENIFSIEEYVTPPYKIPDSAIMCGYPYMPSNPALLHTTNTNISQNDFRLWDMIDSTGLETDSINYHLYSISIQFDKKFKGYSGTPLFIENSETKKWRFAGVVVGSDYDNHFNKRYMVIVKADEVLKLTP